jgi:3,4-dihydroxy 2-butanone 4-phosphate synthase
MLVSIEARAGVSTGISAADRATTLRAAGAPGATAAGLVSPGHVVPVRAARGGVLQRPGVAEAAVALCRLAERPGGAVLCHVLDEDGEAASDACVARLARRHGLAVVSVAEVVASVAADELEWLPVPA